MAYHLRPRYGPGTPGFDNEINKKIYNKLLALCRKGTAGTYVTKAAASNGWEAGRYLLDRYEGFSKQRANSLKNLVETIRHIHGTNMTRHIDKFERICGMMAHNAPTKLPTDEEKVDWFLNSVTEKTYDSVHAGCTDKQLDGTLTFVRVVKLYTNRCFQKYPHFQLDDLTNDKKELSNNATSFHQPRHDKGKGKDYKGKGRQMGKGRGRGREHQKDRNPSHSPNTRPKGKGKGRAPKGRSQTPARTFGDRKPQDPCSYCGGANHTARTCYKRQNDDKNDKTKTTHQQANLNLQIDETALMFQQTVLSVSASNPEITPDTTRWGENINLTPNTTTEGEVKGTTTSDHEENKDSDNTDNRDSGDDYEEYKEDPFYYQEETQVKNNKTEHTIDKEEDPDNEKHTSEDAVERLSNPEQDANQSSSVEPAWGA
jgi:hypothetical protein